MYLNPRFRNLGLRERESFWALLDLALDVIHFTSIILSFASCIISCTQIVFKKSIMWILFIWSLKFYFILFLFFKKKSLFSTSMGFNLITCYKTFSFLLMVLGLKSNLMLEE